MLIASAVAVAALVCGATLWAIRSSDGDGPTSATTVAPSHPSPAAPTTGEPESRGNPTGGTASGGSAAPTAPIVGDPARYGPEGPPTDVTTVQVDTDLGPIAGTNAQAIAGGWKKRLDVSPTYDVEQRLYNAVITYPPARGKLHLNARQPAEGGNEATAVRCIVEYAPGTVGRKLLTSVVDDCFGTVLTAADRKSALTWLVARTYTKAGTEKLRLTRYDVVLDALPPSAIRVGVVGRR